MKISASGGELAGALALAAKLTDNRYFKDKPSLQAARLSGTDGTLTIAVNVLDHALTLSLPAIVDEAGLLAVSAERLAALAAGFPHDATVELRVEGPVAIVACGRSRYRLPTVPLEDLPPLLALAEEVGRVELAREEALALLSRPAFAASDEETRYYLNGIQMHNDGDDLAAVATDGHRLCKLVVRNASGLSLDRSLIIHNSAIEIALKVLRSGERVVLRRSSTLVEIATAKATFISKLIDATYPAYERLFPRPSGNSVTCDRAALRLALERAAAVADARHAVVALTWTAAESALHLALNDTDAADDVIAADVAGSGQVAAQLWFLAEQLDELTGARVRLDHGGYPDAILITDPDDADLTALLMPCRWGAS
jgi:DNA polymerase-3 subunit beta